MARMRRRTRIVLLFVAVLLALAAFMAWQIRRWGLPVPVAYQRVSLTPAHPRAGRSWTYLRTADRSRIVEDDSDSDGTADNFYPEGRKLGSFARPGAQDPEIRWLILCLDGVPYTEMQVLWEEGYFREFFPPVPLISAFPSDSETALTDVFHAGPVPGYEHRYFDRKRNRLSGGALATLTEENIPYLELIDYDQGGLFKGLTYVLPQKSYRADLGRFRKRFLTSQTKIYLAHIASSDSLYHILPQEEMRRLLIEVDSLLRELYLEGGGKLRITVFSDHGQSLVPSRRLELGDYLEQNGWRLRESLERARHAVVPAYGLVGFFAVYAQPQARAELADLLTGLEGVDLVVFADEAGGVLVHSQRGQARVSWDEAGERFRYEIVSGDPLELQPLLAELTAQGRLEEHGWAADSDWFQATRAHRYPDPLYRLRQWATNHVANRADLLVSLRPGYHHGSGSFENIVSVLSTHGALDQAQSAGFAMSTDGPMGGPVRSGDLLPAALTQEKIGNRAQTRIETRNTKLGPDK
jgi:hypothetical protein